MLRWHLQQKLLEQDHAASFGSFLWLCYLPNGVAAKGKCNAAMLGVNVALIYHSDGALNLKWLHCNGHRNKGNSFGRKL